MVESSDLGLKIDDLDYRIFKSDFNQILSRRILQYQADSYANPIPTFRFWSGRKINIIRAKSKTGFLFGDIARVICFLVRVIQQLGFWAQKMQANVDYCYVRRRAECTSLGPGLKHPNLRSLTLVWPRRDVPRHFTWYFFQQMTRAQHDELLFLCVLSYDT